jgi:V8-like Glu-specific endopeptidase
MKTRTLLALVLIATTAGCVKHSVLAETHATTHRLVINDNASCSGTAIGPHLLLSASHCFGEPVTGEGADVSKVTVDGTPVKVIKFV